jgi:hypothetical protein
VRLPYHERARVPQSKITDYLLSSAHRDGREKAVFFRAFGFSSTDWDPRLRRLFNMPLTMKSLQPKILHLELAILLKDRLPVLTGGTQSSVLFGSLRPETLCQGL